MKDLMKREDLISGRAYKIEIDDCCVQAEGVMIFTQYDADPEDTDDDRYGTYLFGGDANELRLAARGHGWTVEEV